MIISLNSVASRNMPNKIVVKGEPTIKFFEIAVGTVGQVSTQRANLFEGLLTPRNVLKLMYDPRLMIFLLNLSIKPLLTMVNNLYI